jgi:hypothetical protein
LLKYAVVNRFFNIPTKEWKKIDYYNRQLLLEVARTAMLEQGIYNGMASAMDGQKLQNMIDMINNVYDGYEEEKNIFDKLKGLGNGD